MDLVRIMETVINVTLAITVILLIVSTINIIYKFL